MIAEEKAARQANKAPFRYLFFISLASQKKTFLDNERSTAHDNQKNFGYL